MISKINDTFAYSVAVDALNGAIEHYYSNPDRSIIPDDEYDALYASVVEYEERTGHIADDSPTQRVQGKATLAPVKHSSPMLSLDKAYDGLELQSFLDQFDLTERKTAKFSVEGKYDGASLSLEYEQGELVRAVTRGDGETGDDVTANAVNIKGVPKGAPLNFTGWIRGEVVILKEDFAEINEPVDGEKPFANARNAAAGALRHSDPAEAKRRRLTFIPYDSSDEDMLMYRSLAAIPSAGNGVRAECEWDTVTDMVRQFLDDKPDWNMEADGVVVKVLDRSARERLGYTGKHPKWAIAFKTQGEVYQTTLDDITWQVGANGAVTPVAELEPTQTNVGTVERATLHNMKYIDDKALHIGATVDFTYAGDVIPQVLRVVEPVAGVWTVTEPPTHCPSCEMELVEEGNSGQIHCPNTLQCQPQIVGRLTKWVWRKAAHIDALGPIIIEKMVRDLDVEDAGDLYALDRADLLKLDKVGEKLADKLLVNIEASKGLGMRRALIGLSIPHVSEGTAKRLARAFPTIEDVFESGQEELLAVDDIGAGTTLSLHDWYMNQQGRHILRELRALGVNLDSEEYVDPEEIDPFDLIDNSVAGKSFVITGEVPGYTRDEFAAVIEKQGGLVKSGVSKKTDFLISDDPTSTTGKMKKARDLGVPIISAEEAKDMVGVIG